MKPLVSLEKVTMFRLYLLCRHVLGKSVALIQTVNF